MNLRASYSPIFYRDVKRNKKKHRDMKRLKECIFLILENTVESREELKRHHNMHTLSGAWAGSNECHICNAGDWLLVWREADGIAYFQRTGTHEDIFR
ncbi:type II toxin-antitoxin system YafQ family toxin [Adlercreutzia sp. ZJ154]|uniref:type II toxin-antitoxin system YafQ family toxin n=1 Tax=Adlercreutzia sp. ZJ154 TaxID=2709790 RepID=UPI0013EE1B9D|nr:type II toxin-antitoxin system YafQ family toxin [Adlercreutzia sp. ZJ154]